MFKPTDLLQQELIGLCRDLIRIPSVNGQNTEKDVVNAIAQFTEEHGLNTEILGADPERPCVLVEAGPTGDNALLLIAHTDTVGVGEEKAWDLPPFEGAIVDGKIFGRGAADNKGGIVAAIGALLLLKDLSASILDRPVCLVCVPDEESGATGKLGVKFLHTSGKLSAPGAIYTYPGLETINIGHRGVWRIRLHTYGKSFHTGSRRWQDEDKSYNALTGMCELLLALEHLKFEHESVTPLFERFATVITPTFMKGGIGPSTTPDHCESLVDIRLVPSYPRERLQSLINDLISEICQKRPFLRVEISTEVEVPPTCIPEDSAVAVSLADSIEECLNKRPQFAVSGPANESYLLNQIGIPTCCAGPNGNNTHSANEYVSVDSIFHTAQIYAMTAVKICERL